jgi:hypothetical protein
MNKRQSVKGKSDLEYIQAAQHQSEIVEKTNNPFFKPTKIMLGTIAHG